MAAYRAFRDHADHIAAETDHPDRFTDGTEWFRLIHDALTLGHVSQFSPEQWSALTGVTSAHISTPVTAGAAWALLPRYTAARMDAKWLTTDALTQLEQLKQDLYTSIRSAKTTAEIRGHRLAIYIADQASTDPDRRATWVRLAQANDLQAIAMYRPRAPTTLPPWQNQLDGLRPGTCLPISEAQRLEWAAAPRRGFHLARWTQPRPGGWQICRTLTVRLGFAVR